MPSPFPGMDPYLENRPWWRGIHNSLITELLGSLNRQMPPQFFASMEERVFLSLEDGVYPDVALVQRIHTSTKPKPSQAGTLVADEPLSVSYMDEEVYEPYLEIRTTDTEQKLVAVIEVLSPKNKSRESNGRDVYRKKQDTVLKSATHLIEIDLLREGAHTIAAPYEPVAGRLGTSWHYAICLHRAGNGKKFDVWPVSIRERLPKISVPLTEGFPDLVVDMQAIVTEVYDRGVFDRRIDYRIAPVPSLPPGDNDWADALLRSEGLR